MALSPLFNLPRSYTDEELLAMMQSEGAEEAKAMRIFFYDKKTRQVVDAFARRLGLSDVGMETAWEKAVMKFFQLVKKGQYRGSDGGLRGFLYGIGKGMVLNELHSEKGRSDAAKKKIQSVVSVPDFEAYAHLLSIFPAIGLEALEKKNIWDAVGSLRGNCPDVLRVWASEHIREDSAQELGMSARDFSNRVVECREILETFLRKNPLINQLWSKIWNNLS